MPIKHRQQKVLHMEGYGWFIGRTYKNHPYDEERVLCRDSGYYCSKQAAKKALIKQLLEERIEEQTILDSWATNK